MTVKDLKERLAQMPDDMEVYAQNRGLYRRVESVDVDDNYPDVLIVAGDVE